MDVAIIGHGSLMSGKGLAFSGSLRVKEIAVVALDDCRRGFAKLSRYGDRFATDLEVGKTPLRGHVVSPSSPPDGRVETLALTVPLEDACLLVKREGYSPIVVRQLADMAEARGQTVAAFLWEMGAGVDHDPVVYRRRLFALTSFTSAHYIPHPVSLGGTDYALVFLAPGFEGTGADDVVSVRQQTGIRTVMTASETWGRKPNEDQLSYFLSCMLGGVHGVNVRDFLSPLREDHTLVATVRGRLRGFVDTEVAQFCGVTGLSRDGYRRRCGEAEAALRRGGLAEFLA